MSFFGIDGIAVAAAKAAFVVFLLVGIHAPGRAAMPHTQNSGQAHLRRSVWPAFAGEKFISLRRRSFELSTRYTVGVGCTRHTCLGRRGRCPNSRRQFADVSFELLQSQALHCRLGKNPFCTGLHRTFVLRQHHRRPSSHCTCLALPKAPLPVEEVRSQWDGVQLLPNPSQARSDSQALSPPGPTPSRNWAISSAGR